MEALGVEYPFPSVVKFGSFHLIYRKKGIPQKEDYTVPRDFSWDEGCFIKISAALSLLFPLKSALPMNLNWRVPR